MAQIWTDQSYSMSHIFADNITSDFIFRWAYITFSNERQAMAEVRYRKVNTFPSIIARIGLRDTDNIWSPTISVGRLEDMTTWTLSGGQRVPPAEANRVYSDIRHVAFPTGTFSDGIWSFQVRIKNVGEESGEWGGWANHVIEISEYDDRMLQYGSSTTAVKSPEFKSEGVYGMRATTMSAAGILSAESPEVTFDVWNTDRYVHNNGLVDAAPVYYHTGSQVIRIQQ